MIFRIAMLVGSVAMVLSASGGCASSAEEQQQKQQRAGDNAARERAFQFSGGDTLLQRATFDMGCPGNQMEAQVLQRVGMFQVATSVGVRGCGRQANYIRGYGGYGGAGTWMLNGPIMQMAPQQQPEGPPPGAPPPPPPPAQ
ncbi:MAG TPA: hypothetical protein VGL86_20750 [Polyangia bacterium]|jgi:hypothetical protein